MSGVTTSSLSLAWTLRNWVILDYEEANGLTVRPWAPFLSFQSLEPSPFTGLSRLDPVDLAFNLKVRDISGFDQQHKPIGQEKRQERRVRRWKRIVKPKMKRTRIETPSGLDQQIGDDKERIYAWFLFSFPDLIIFQTNGKRRFKDDYSLITSL